MTLPGSSLPVEPTKRPPRLRRPARRPQPAAALLHMSRHQRPGQPCPSEAGVGVEACCRGRTLSSSRLTTCVTRFSEVLVTPAGRDGGLDVVAPSVGAQVKYMAMPTGSPDIQRLAGAALFTHKLFYATGYSTSALTQADVLAVALFQYDNDGNVAPVNAAARNLGNRTPDPVPKRNVFGQLDFEGRQIRVMRWAQQIQTASETPISNRKRKGAKQLAEKEQALRFMVFALGLLEDSNNPLYKRRCKERTLEEAEKSLKQSAKFVRVNLR